MRSRRIYVSAHFAQFRRARLLIDDLADAGHVITHDWTRVGAAWGKGHHRPDFTLVTARSEVQDAQADLAGAVTCDLLILLGDDDILGAAFEAGAAMATGGLVWIVDCGFSRIERVRFWTGVPGVELVESEHEVRRRLGAAAMAGEAA